MQWWWRWRKENNRHLGRVVRKTITETRPLKNVVRENWVPIRLCELKQGFKDYRVGPNPKLIFLIAGLLTWGQN